MNMGLIFDYCRANGYIVPINKLDNHSGCIAFFPQNKLLNIPAKIKTYVIVDSGIDIYTRIKKSYVPRFIYES